MLQIITSKTRPDTFMPEGKKIWSPNPGLVLFRGTLYELNLRELYDRLYHGRVAPSVLFRALEGTTLLAAHDPAVQTGTWPSGTILKYENHGRIQGIGGKGGDGGDASAGPTDPAAQGQDGEDGGDALLVQYDLELDNTDGEIFSGGGGGGGGASAAYVYEDPGTGDCLEEIRDGGGGGGGSGTLAGAGGSGLNNGSSGSADAGGSGGNGDNPGGTAQSGDGGDGGSPGSAGQNGANGQDDFDTVCGSEFDLAGGSGGSPGDAIVQDGATVTITGGNNSTQIKGAIV